RLYDGHLAFLPTWGESTIKEISLDTELIEQDSGQIYAFEIYEHMLDTASEVSEQELELSEMDEADASLNVIQIEEMKLEEAQPLSILLSEEAMLSQTIPYATIGSEVEQIDLFKTKIEVLETTKDDVQTVYTSSIVFSSLIETNTVSVAFTVNTDVIQYEAMMDTDNTIVVSFDDIDHVYTDEAVEIINDESIAVAYAHDDCIDSLLQSNETLSCEQSISADHDELSFFEKTKEDYEVIIADENTLTDDHTVFEADVNETDGAEMHAFEVHEHVTDTFESDHSVPTDLIYSDKLSNASEYVIDKLPLGSFTSSQILDMHAHGLEHVTHERIIGAEVSPIDNMSAGSTIAVELSESNTAISISVFESSESIFDQSVSVSDIEASESLLITFDNQPIITAEIHESEETESVPILLSNLHKTEISDAISVISTDTTSLTPMEWSADIPAAIEDTDANKNVIKEKKRIWLIPMRANFWNKWFTKKTR
ncbi:MAG TPA: hypothetical protein VIL29_08970, partial [Pseudothermotoga sp.]